MWWYFFFCIVYLSVVIFKCCVGYFGRVVGLWMNFNCLRLRFYDCRCCKYSGMEV